MANTGWYIKLKIWQQLHNIKFTREITVSDALAAEKFSGKSEKKVKKVVIQPNKYSN
jgi:hypothetical protein